MHSKKGRNGSIHKKRGNVGRKARRNMDGNESKTKRRKE
jgi:hypothetical protein